MQDQNRAPRPPGTLVTQWRDASSLVLHPGLHQGVVQGPDSFDRNLDVVSRLQKLRGVPDETDTLRGSCQNDGARQQSGILRQVGDQLLNREDHIRRVRVLLLHPIDMRRETKVLHVPDLLREDQHGPQGAEVVERLGPAPLAPPLLPLPPPGGQVVGHREPGDIVHNLVLRDIHTEAPIRRSSDDHSQLNLVVHLRGVRRVKRDGHLLPGVGQGVQGLHELDGVLGDFCLDFCAVLAVVQADPQQLRRRNGLQEARHLHFFPGELSRLGDSGIHESQGVMNFTKLRAAPPSRVAARFQEGLTEHLGLPA
mmetsp:Transcript_22960/g.55611  ORF Transcript_22960/g.55611 Transcript_22960/m.55611 type:complete len:310 (+) Transcript_22960:51-980(+)